MIPVTLAVALAFFAPVVPRGAALAAQEHELSFGTIVRITGATVLRGGPASPPTLFPAVLQGNVVGMHGDTLLFETGNEPVYWIPLGTGYPLVERRATVTAMKRSVLVATTVSGAAGATFAWALTEECWVNEDAVALGLPGGNCADEETEGAAALRGFAIGAGIGMVAGLLLGRFAKRQAWVRIPVDQLRFIPMPERGLAFSLPVGGRPGVR